MALAQTLAQMIDHARLKVREYTEIRPLSLNRMIEFMNTAAKRVALQIGRDNWTDFGRRESAATNLNAASATYGPIGPLDHFYELDYLEVVGNLISTKSRNNTRYVPERSKHDVLDMHPTGLDENDRVLYTMYPHTALDRTWTIEPLVKTNWNSPGTFKIVYYSEPWLAYANLNDAVGYQSIPEIYHPAIIEYCVAAILDAHRLQGAAQTASANADAMLQMFSGGGPVSNVALPGGLVK